MNSSIILKKILKQGELSQRFGVQGIPTLILLNGDTGEIYTDDARSQIQYDDVEGENFP